MTRPRSRKVRIVFSARLSSVGVDFFFLYIFYIKGLIVFISAFTYTVVEVIVFLYMYI